MLREFSDKSGMEWLVWDVYPTAQRDPSQGWLCFESGGEKQRVAPVPPGWESWSARQLEDTLERARISERSPMPARGTDARP